VTEFVEDGQRLLPGFARRAGVARSVMSAAFVYENLGLVVADAEVSEQAQGVLIAGEGQVMVAEVVMSVAQAVPRIGLSLKITEFLEQGEGLLAV
jgi:hypothetical protein